VGQEFYRGVAARRKNASESVLTALVTLVARSRRRYGGYIVHLGVGVMFLGFAGRGWELEKEAVMTPGETIRVGNYDITYRGPRMEVDTEKRMIFADIDVALGGTELGQMNPAQFIYMKAQMPTTEVAMLHRLRDDLYVVVGNANPQTKKATFRFRINPLVSWIWVGVLLMISGAVTSLWPEVAWRRLGAWGTVRLAATGATGIMVSVVMATAPARAVGERGLRAPPTDIGPSLELAQSLATQSAAAPASVDWDAFERREADPHATSRKPTTLIQQQAAHPLNHLPEDGEITH
jgi:cytochrome c-type biogenesis protein CcmF